MSTTRPSAYRGKLTAAQVAEGINFARSNAKRLAADAEFLLGAGRHPTAAALAVLAMEEAGKAPILRALALARSDKEVVDAWREYRRHTSKNRLWGLFDALNKGAQRLADFAPLFGDAAEHPALLDSVKQLGFYTDCYGDSHWSSPAEVVDHALASHLVAHARLLANGNEVTAREIELWIEHVGPVWKKDRHWMERALIQWYAALQREGLARPGENEMERFIETGLADAPESGDF